LTLEAPERLGRVIRRFFPRRSTEARGRLLFHPPPAITVTSREHSLTAARELAATSRHQDCDQPHREEYFRHRRQTPWPTVALETTPMRERMRHVLDLSMRRALDLGSRRRSAPE
jgi:hypothetical protein